MFDEKDTVLVLGVGRSGLATAEVLTARGVRVVAYDDKGPDELTEQRAALERLGVALLRSTELEGAVRLTTAAVLSPGVPLTNPAVLQVARAGVPVYSEIEVAYRLSAAPIIAVTGSKGKSTTTALIGHLLNGAGMRARVGGNIGNPLIRETAAANADEWIVAEVSSFQLEGIREFSPRISVLLNITADHLDRYHSMEEYAEAKYRIFANQRPDDAFVGNADDELCAALRRGGREIPCKAYWFSATGDPLSSMIARNGSIVWKGPGLTGRTVLAKPGDLQLRGAHNVANAMAASLAALLAGAPVAKVRSGLRSFAPLPHRLAKVATSDGVDWIDDSKATNPDAVLKALASFDAPIVLIAGGKGKNTDFSALGHAASRRAKMVVLIGEAAQEIGAQVDGTVLRYASSLEEAVNVAGDAVGAGDVVLLSPGCASFDMFDSAEHRGDVFCALARKRASGVGST